LFAASLSSRKGRKRRFPENSPWIEGEKGMENDDKTKEEKGMENDDKTKEQQDTNPCKDCERHCCCCPPCSFKPPPWWD
jgi:hypothetical protein